MTKKGITSGAAAMGAGFFLNANVGAFRAPAAARSLAMENRSSVPFAPRNAARPSGPGLHNA